MIRDYSHRFTVDEHSFVAIENLHRCGNRNRNGTSVTRNCSTNSSSPDLLYLALLLHDTGKGARRITTWLPAWQVPKAALDRLDLDPPIAKRFFS